MNLVSMRAARSFRAWRRALVFSLVALCLISVGCTTGTTHLEFIPRQRDIRKGVTTQSQVYQMLGVPTDIFVVPGNRKLLLWNQDVTRGMGVGLGYGMFPILSFRHQHASTDTLYVLVGANGIVEDVDVWPNADLAQYKLWPFGG